MIIGFLVGMALGAYVGMEYSHKLLTNRHKDDLMKVTDLLTEEKKKMRVVKRNTEKINVKEIREMLKNEE